MTLEQRVASAANTALRDNPAVRQASDLWVLNASRAHEAVGGWVRDGIPETVILEAISAVCRAFTPTPENPRIGSFRYFDLAVRRAWGKSKEPSEEELKRKAREGMREALG